MFVRQALLEYCLWDGWPAAFNKWNHRGIDCSGAQAGLFAYIILSKWDIATIECNVASLRRTLVPLSNMALDEPWSRRARSKHYGVIGHTQKDAYLSSERATPRIRSLTIATLQVRARVYWYLRIWQRVSAT